MTRAFIGGPELGYVTACVMPYLTSRIEGKGTGGGSCIEAKLHRSKEGRWKKSIPSQTTAFHKCPVTLFLMVPHSRNFAKAPCCAI